MPVPQESSEITLDDYLQTQSDDSTNEQVNSAATPSCPVSHPSSINRRSSTESGIESAWSHQAQKKQKRNELKEPVPQESLEISLDDFLEAQSDDSTRTLTNEQGV